MKPHHAKHHVVLALQGNKPDNRMRMSGALRYLSTRDDIDVRILDTASDSVETDILRLSSDWKIDGIIFTHPQHIRPLLSPAAAKGKHRTILAMMDGPYGFTAAQIEIRMDSQSVMDRVVDLLRKRGFNRFAFCGTDAPDECQYSAELESRLARSATADPPLPAFHEDPVVSYSENIQRGARWVAALPKPCSIICYSDMLARDLLNACRYAHVNVPEQIAIIGMDDSPEICEMTRPTLSSTLPDFEGSGYLAAEELCRAMRSRRCGKVLRTYSLAAITERASTQDLHGGGRFVQAATEMIRKTDPSGLSADNIARRLHISRRLLEIHFKKIVGHGVHAEISRQRLGLIRSQLTQTSLPIGEIAASCGYHSLTAAQIAFKKRFGQSMQECRKANGVTTVRK